MDATKKKQPGEKKTQTATEQAMETGAPAISALEKRKKKLSASSKLPRIIF